MNTINQKLDLEIFLGFAYFNVESPRYPTFYTRPTVYTVLRYRFFDEMIGEIYNKMALFEFDMDLFEMVV